MVHIVEGQYKLLTTVNLMVGCISSHVLCAKAGSTHEVLLQYTAWWWLSQGKRTCATELWTELAAFFTNTYLHWNDKLIDELWLSEFSILLTFSWKLTKLACHFKEDTSLIIVSTDKIRACKWKFEFWRSCICFCELISFLLFTAVVIKSVVLRNFW